MCALESTIGFKCLNCGGGRFRQIEFHPQGKEEAVYWIISMNCINCGYNSLAECHPTELYADECYPPEQPRWMGDDAQSQSR